MNKDDRSISPVYLDAVPDAEMPELHAELLDPQAELPDPHADLPGPLNAVGPISLKFLEGAFREYKGMFHLQAKNLYAIKKKRS